jgi:ubiquinol-cytochrome c reductase iron-sulfur subunit
MSDQKMDSERRNLILATTAAGSVAVVAAAVPFVGSLAPSERAKAAGAPVEADIGNLKAGEKMVVKWRGKPVWILRRTKEMLASLETTKDSLADPDSKEPQQPEYARNTQRARPNPNPDTGKDGDDYLVVIGICTHLGCSPSDKSAEGNWHGGFLCPCHGSQFDLAGRVFKSQPAPTNLEVPPYKFLSPTRILIGDDSGAGTSSEA